MVVTEIPIPIPILGHLTQASKLGLTGSLHVWFTPVWATLDLSGNATGDCTNDDIYKALSNTFGVLGSDLVVANGSSTKLVSGQVGGGRWETAAQRVQHFLMCLHACARAWLGGHVHALMSLHLCVMCPLEWLSVL